MSNDVAQYDERAAELAVAGNTAALSVEGLTTPGSFLSTLPVSTPAEKISVLNALSNPEALTDNEGVVIELAGVIAQNVKFSSAQHDGAKVDGVGLYLLGKDGRTFITVSAGMYGEVEKLLGVFGSDSAKWPDGLAIVPRMKNIGGGKRTWTVEWQILDKPAKK